MEDEGRWREVNFQVNDDALLPYARRMTDEMRRRGAPEPDVQLGLQRSRHTLRSQSLARLRAMIKLAMAEALDRWLRKIEL